MPRGLVGKSMRKAMRGHRSPTQPSKNDVACLVRKTLNKTVEEAEADIKRRQCSGQRRNKKGKKLDPEINITPQDYMEAELFLRQQAEKVIGCKLPSMFEPKESRIPNMVRTTAKEWSIILSKVLRVYRNYSSIDSLDDMSTKNLAIGCLASEQFIMLIEHFKENPKFEYTPATEEEHYVEYK